MSHIVEIRTAVRDPSAVQAACKRLGLPVAKWGDHKLYNDVATGLAVQLPGWSYPVVCHTDTGAVKYDTFNGHWGEQKELDSFMQAYTLEKCKIEARKGGHSVSERVQQDGSIKLTISVGA